MHDCAEKYERITKLLIEKKLMISTMESCTSGMIASLITDTEGSSAVLKGAFVTYCNEAKIRCGVPAEIISRFGVYSAGTAAAMASACRKAYDADIGIGVTGSFGNIDPANPDSVPGEVHFAIDFRGETRSFLISGISESCRREGKIFVADQIADALLTLIV